MWRNAVNERVIVQALGVEFGGGILPEETIAVSDKLTPEVLNGIP
jgi:hypothetical protein